LLSVERFRSSTSVGRQLGAVWTELPLECIIFSITCPCGSNLEAADAGRLFELAGLHAQAAHGRTVSKPKVLAAMRQRIEREPNKDNGSAASWGVTEEQHDIAEPAEQPRINTTGGQGARESDAAQKHPASLIPDEMKLLLGDVAAVVAGIVASQNANAQLASAAEIVHRQLKKSALTSNSTDLDTPITEEILRLATEASPHVKRIVLAARSRATRGAGRTKGTARKGSEEAASTPSDTQIDATPARGVGRSADDVIRSAADIKKEQEEIHQLEKLLADIERENRVSAVNIQLQDMVRSSSIGASIHQARMNVIRNTHA